MANLPAPSNFLKNKSNVNPVVNRLQEATAEDFKEIADLFTWILNFLEGKSGTLPTRQSAGVYTSLAQLRAAIPQASPDEYAIIEPYPGATIQIAVWNDVIGDWELQQDQQQFVFIQDYNARPNPGQENTFYLTLDNYNLYVFKNNQYNILNPPSGIYSIDDGTNWNFNVIKDPNNENPDTNAIQLKDHVFGLTDSSGTRYLDCIVSAIPFNKNDANTYKRITEKQFA